MDKLKQYLDFLMAVTMMRRNQKEYFRTRDKNILEKSKKSEREVDMMIHDLMDSNKLF